MADGDVGRRGGGRVSGGTGAADKAAVASMLDAWRGVDARLVEEMERFAGRFPPGTVLTPGQVLRMERYQALHAQVERELGALETAARGTLSAGMWEAAGLGVEQALYSLEALGVGGTLNRPAPRRRWRTWLGVSRGRGGHWRRCWSRCMDWRRRAFCAS